MILEQTFNFIPSNGSEPTILRLTIGDIARIGEREWEITFFLEGMMPEPKTISSPYAFQCIELAVFLLRNFLEAHARIGSVKDMDGQDYHNALPFANAENAKPNFSDAYKQHLQKLDSREGQSS